MEDDFSIFHIGNFLPFHFHSIPKIFHSILKFSSIFHSILKSSSIFHSILPYQRNFRLEAMQHTFCCFAPFQCCKQPLVKVRLQYKDATTGIWYAYCTFCIGIAWIWNWGEGKTANHAVTSSKVFEKRDFLWDKK